MMRYRGKLSIMAVLLGGFLLTSVLGMGLTLYLGLNVAYDNTRKLWLTITHDDLSAVHLTMQERIERIKHRNKWIATQVAKGALNPDAVDDWNSAINVLSADDIEITAYGLITPDGRFTGFNARDMTPIQSNINPDEVVFSDHLLALGPSPGVTTYPRWHPVLMQTVVSERIPLFYGGNYLGTFVQYLSLSNLSRDLIRGQDTYLRVPFIIAPDRVIAHPGLLEWQNTVTDNPDHPANAATNTVQGAVDLPHIADIGDPVLARQADWQDIILEAPLADVAGNIRLAGLELDDRFYVIMTRQFDETSMVPIMIGMHFDESLFRPEQDKLSFSYMVGIGVLILAILVAIAIAHNFARPLRRFSRATRLLETDLMDDLPVLPGSYIREYDDAARSFNNMTITLRDRERISRLFGKFLPASIARELLESGTDSGILPPRQRVATVLFVDLAGFTSLCEQIEPTRIIAILNAYFDKVTTIIEGHGGIITQFQGDAVLAVFNAFGDLENHADAALETSIDIQKIVHAQQFDGQTLHCRCGINTGPMVAGNVGATGRLSFTVHGDAVNTAARLEAENKVLGTKILLSQTTRDLLHDPAQVTQASQVQLRGRSEMTAIYTVSRP
ncbi:adenylate/guanylate cyclase domain-containing protein [Thalassospira sp.]|uniref:adenylate/guanylate cyclase domain-containing protein n=1 Tax=Thalassospira sp. TaxID=1912094 RepID=UPI0027330BB8|nr:adenylate/guanylate cyclase domain-containing protein [Thalassospira sp.]MDP2698178.1 adenylate/guanylate cyclase domain-containing protein [Thalassospira sp.]